MNAMNQEVALKMENGESKRYDRKELANALARTVADNYPKWHAHYEQPLARIYMYELLMAEGVKVRSYSNQKALVPVYYEAEKRVWEYLRHSLPR